MKYNLDLSMEKVTKISCVLYCYPRETITNTRQKLATKLEEIQKEKNDTDIWLEVQTLKIECLNYISVLAKRIKDPYTKTSDLSNLASTAESITINILKLESANITAIKQSNIILENHIKT